MATELLIDEVGTDATRCGHTRLRDVADAIEGVLTNPQVLSALSNAIDTATSPIVLTNAQKRRAVLLWAKNQLDQG